MINSKIEPIEIFYEWDGFPMIFNFKQEDKMFLAYCHGFVGDDVSFKYFVVETNEKEISDFSNNKITMYDFLDRDKLYVITISPDFDVKKVREVSFSDLPSFILPLKGVYLKRELK